MTAPTPIGSTTRLDTLVSDVLANRAALAELQAREAELLASAVDIVAAREAEVRSRGRFGSDLPLREVSAELAAALRLSDRTVQGRIGEAHRLVTEFPATFEAWRQARISDRHATVIADAGATFTEPDAREQYELLVLPIAETESAARLRVAAHALAAQIDPACARERQRLAEDDRCVGLFDLGDGMSRVFADLPAVRAHGIFDRLTQMAAAAQDATRATGNASGDGSDLDLLFGGGDGHADGDDGGEPDDPRTLNQLRADIFSDMLLTGTPTAHGIASDAGDSTNLGLGSIRGVVQVTIPVLTLAGVGDEPATLAGSGPIDAQTARALAGAAPGWDRVFTDPSTGAPVAVDRYRPSSELRRYLRVRDEHCRFPGCRQACRRCDVDHTIDAVVGGATSAENLAHFCRRHHILKHNSAWTVQQKPGGILEWTSPTGRRHSDRPPATLRFIPDPVDDGSPPPF